MFFQYAGTPMSALMQCGLVGAFSTLGFYGACPLQLLDRWTMNIVQAYIWWSFYLLRA
jgi:hypothetical protein